MSTVRVNSISSAFSSPPGVTLKVRKSLSVHTKDSLGEILFILDRRKSERGRNATSLFVSHNGLPVRNPQLHRAPIRGGAHVV